MSLIQSKILVKSVKLIKKVIHPI